MQLKDGTLLQGGKYKIERHISSGGFGNTYEGVHSMMDTRIAIKEFFPKMFCNRDENTSHITVATQSNRDLVEKLRKKFVEEAKAIFKMNHPNIVKVHDIFEENGTAYYVMDYINGNSLTDMVKQRGALPEAEAIGYISQAAEALKYVHSMNRLHLDVKPSNIMIDKNGNVILIDFGASKHYDMESGENTSTLMGVNTKGYAPIEQSTQSFTKFSPATDIYSLGATLYKLLTGITPPDANLLVAKEETLVPMTANISVATQDAVLKAMTLIRAERPQTVEEFLQILNSSADDERTIITEEKKIDVKDNTIGDEPAPAAPVAAKPAPAAPVAAKPAPAAPAAKPAPAAPVAAKPAPAAPVAAAPVAAKPAPAAPVAAKPAPAAPVAAKPSKYYKFMMSGICTSVLVILFAIICVFQPILFNAAENAGWWYKSYNYETFYSNLMNEFFFTIVCLGILLMPVIYILFYRGIKSSISFYKIIASVCCFIFILLMILFSQFTFVYYDPHTYEYYNPLFNIFISFIINSGCYLSVLAFVIRAK